MSDYAGVAHFRTSIESALRAEGYRGGYVFFVGRFAGWDGFDAAVRDELNSEGCILLEYDAELQIESRDDLDSAEQRELFDNLEGYPLQFKNRHLYRNDDA